LKKMKREKKGEREREVERGRALGRRNGDCCLFCLFVRFVLFSFCCWVVLPKCRDDCRGAKLREIEVEMEETEK